MAATRMDAVQYESYGRGPFGLKVRIFPSCGAKFLTCTYVSCCSMLRLQSPVLRKMRIQRLRKKLCVEVYRQLDSWRKITAVPPISQDVSLLQNRGAFLSGVVYWIANGSSEKCSFILSFELGSEVFQKILYPDKLHEVVGLITFQVFEKSLSLFHHRLDLVEGKDCYCDAWVLEADTWKMIRTIYIPPRVFVAYPLGFRTNSRVHIVVFGLDFSGELVLYDPVSNQLKDTGIKDASF